MTDRPILFSDEMVRAILDGRKTQTRRVVKFHKHLPLAENEHAIWQSAGQAKDGSWIFWDRPDMGPMTNRLYNKGGYICPHGIPGDRLWCREAWNTVENDKGADCVQYRANIPESDWKLYGPWRPSIFMPRWASRITLEIVSVRVERLQDISEADAEAEGIHLLGLPESERHNHPRKHIVAFQEIWNLINAKRGHPWESNPFVWAISFRRI